MKILRNFLIILLIATVTLCIIIGLSALRPDLFEGFGKKPENTSELASVSEAHPTVSAEPSAIEPPVPEPAPVSENTASQNSTSANTASQNSVSEDNAATDEDLIAGLTKSISSDYVPGSVSLNVPDALKSLTGFMEPHGRQDILDPKKADEIESSLSTGPTGDDLDFDKEFYPYYHMLDDKGKHLYRQIYANAYELNPDFRAVEKDVSFASLKNVFEALFNDHPELYWLNTEYSAGYREGGDCLELILSFNRTAQDLEKTAAEFDAGANKVARGAVGDEYEMEKGIHDAICEDLTYNRSAEMNQSAYSAFANNSTVCAGYARAFQYIMTRLGIPCYYCRGVAGEPHAWNIIKLGDDYYNVDVTWDDSTGTWQYEYLNLSDDEISKDHRRTSLSVYLPACRGGQYSHLEQAPDEESTVDRPESSGSTSENKNNSPPSDENNNSSSNNEAPQELPEGTYVSSLDDYYNQCRQIIQDKGKGTYSFDIYTTDKDVYDKCMSAYSDGSAKSGYMNGIFESIDGAKGFSVNFIGEEGNGVYKMTQKVRLY